MSTDKWSGWNIPPNYEAERAERVANNARDEIFKAIADLSLAIKRAEKAEHQRDALLKHLKEMVFAFDYQADLDSRKNTEHSRAIALLTSRQLIAEIEGDKP